MKIAVRLVSGGKIFVARVRYTNAWADEFLDKVIEAFGETRIIKEDDYEDEITDCLPYSVRDRRDIAAVESPTGEVIRVDRFFELTPTPNNPFAIFWPQEILEAIGIPCWGEEYA